MNTRYQSNAGEAWDELYRAGNVTWVDVSHVDQTYINQLAESEFVGALRQYVPTLKDVDPCLKILEAGCGLGLYSFALAALGFHVTAFDYSPTAIEIATALRDRLGFSPEQVNFSVGNLLSIDQPDNTYDVVFNQAVLEYFTDDHDFDTVLQEMSRILRPGGYLAVIVQNTTQLTLPLKRRLGHLGFTNQPPVRLISASDLIDHLHKLGLTELAESGIDAWKGLLHGIPALTQTPLLHRLTYLTYRFTSKIPLPAMLRSKLALQFVVSGKKGLE
jgi:2-polyprenyl-3-methyl-5-hydroxy-6-metoxy-1,4-benzoquinol methylase